MNKEKYNINISIDESSIQLCIDDKFYKILNSSTSRDEFQMVGMHIMDMVDSLDDILKFREIKATRLDDTMKRKINAFSLLLANSIVPQRKDTQIEKFIKTNAAQQAFKAVALKHKDMETKSKERTLSDIQKEKEERLNIKPKEKDYTDDAVLEQAISELHKSSIVSQKPVEKKEKKVVNIKSEIDKSIEIIEQKVEKKTVAETLKQKQDFTFDQQYLIDLYIKNFGKIKVSREKFRQNIKTNRYIKLFGTYTDYVTAVLA